jgi:hypothetical protein
MRSWRHIIFFFLCLQAYAGVAGQEVRGLTENPVIKEYLRHRPAVLKSAKAADTLNLPFFEDFSTSSVVPDPSKWTDASVFVNNSFGLDPISIGVATLDAIDANGELYSTNNLPVSSDKLTSLPFDLSQYRISKEPVTLSFFYQPGGKGEVPEKTDSLILEFFYASDNTWHNIWSFSTDTIAAFRQKIQSVPDTFCQAGFRFRFRNKTSISPNEVTGGDGALSNADCWNIDYIMMNTRPDAEHRSIDDITQVDIPRELLDFYESVPWAHLNNAQSITRNNMRYLIRNLTTGDSINVGRSYYVHNLHTGTTEYYDQYYSKSPPRSLVTWLDPFFAPFTRNDNSSEGALEVVSYLITPANQVKGNDTSRIVMNFKNYYAYDDGNPEYGFGISGESTAGSLLACRFRIYQADTLRALQMLFNNTRNHANAELGFQLCVWKDEGGLPGDLLYMSPETFTPGDDLPFLGFNTYPFPEEANLVITDTSFFAGWKQSTEEFLNLGYDVNRNNLSRIFVNISGDWFNPGSSLIPGTPMIRALFGSKEIVTGNPDIPVHEKAVELFPNPASDIVHIRTTGFTLSHISIIDLQGRILLSEDGDHHEIDVSSIPPGMYLLQLSANDGSFVNRKMVIHHK